MFFSCVWDARVPLNAPTSFSEKLLSGWCCKIPKPLSAAQTVCGQHAVKAFLSNSKALPWLILVFCFLLSSAESESTQSLHKSLLQYLAQRSMHLVDAYRHSGTGSSIWRTAPHFRGSVFRYCAPFVLWFSMFSSSYQIEEMWRYWGSFHMNQFCDAMVLMYSVDVNRGLRLWRCSPV